MKPFDLDKALKGAKVVTRDGRPVKIAGYNPDAEKVYWRLLGWVNGDPSWWCESGKTHTSEESFFDLFMAPKTRKEWVVRYIHGGPLEDYISISGPFDSFEKAQRFSIDTEGTIHEITITE